MKISASCLRCLIEKQAEAIAAYEDEDLKSRYMKAVLRLLGESGDELSAPVLVAQIQKLHRAYFGGGMDYSRIKTEYNRKVLSMEEDMWKAILAHPQPLRLALTLARAGNYIDFGAMKTVEQGVFASLLEKASEELVSEAVYEAFCREAKEARSCVYLADNCGEIVFDKLVVRRLLEECPQLDITVIVRGSQVLNDATMEDAEEVGLTQEVRVLPNGTDIAGTDLLSVSSEVRESIGQADIILSKGQGNFETMHGCGLNVYYLFLCKCDWFVKRFALTINEGVFLREKEVIKNSLF